MNKTSIEASVSEVPPGTHRLGLTPHRRMLLENLFWLTADKGVRIFHGIFVVAAVARFLGPADYGLLAIAASILSMMTPLITLGFDSVLVREFVVEEDHRSLYWTVFVARVILGSLAYVILFALIVLNVVPTQSRTEALVLLIGCLPLASLCLDTSNLLFQAKVRGKWVVWSSNLVIAIAACVKLVLVAKCASVAGFAIVNAMSVVLTGIAVMVSATWQDLVPRYVRPSWLIFKRLLWECWPLILSSLSIALYMNVDVIMLRYLESTEVVGVYSIAVRLSAFWFFAPMALAQTLFPGLTRSQKAGERQYHGALYRYLRLNTISAYATVLVAELMVPFVIRWLFGEQYSESIPCFQAHALAIFFVFVGVARSQYLNLERLHLYGMWATVIGIVLNTILNYVLIQEYSAMGAAIATVVSFSVSAFLTSFFFPRTRWFGHLQLRAIVSPWRSKIPTQS